MTDVFDPDWGIKGKQSNLFEDKTLRGGTRPGLSRDIDLISSTIKFVQKASQAKRHDSGFDGPRTAIIFHYETRPVSMCYDPIELFNADMTVTDQYKNALVHVYYCVPAGGICSSILPPRSKTDFERIYQLPRFYALSSTDGEDIADFALRECVVEIRDKETGQYGVFLNMLETQSTTIESYKNKYFGAAEASGAQGAFTSGNQVGTVGEVSQASAAAQTGQGIGASAPGVSGAGAALPPVPEIITSGKSVTTPLKRFRLKYNGKPPKTRVFKGEELQRLLTTGLIIDKDGFRQQFPEPSLPLAGVVLKHPNLKRAYSVVLTQKTMNSFMNFLDMWPGPGIFGISYSLRQSGAKFSAHGYGLGLDLVRHTEGKKKFDPLSGFPPIGNNDGHHNFVRRQIGFLQKAGFTDFGLDQYGVRHVDARLNNTHMDAYNRSKGRPGFSSRGLVWLYLAKGDKVALGAKARGDKGFNPFNKCRSFAKKHNTTNVLLKYVPPEFLTIRGNKMPDFRSYAEPPATT